MYHINFYVYITILCLCLAASLSVYLKKGQHIYLKLFSPFLVITLLVEVTAYTLTQNGIENSYLYHYFFPIEFTFYLFIAYHILSRKILKKAVVASTFIYLVIIGIYYTLFKIHGFPTIAYCLGAVLVLFFYSFYFFEIVRLPINLTPKREESFWIFFGVVLYYSTTLPIWLTIQFMVGFSDGTLSYLSTLLMLMNYSLYISFIIAFFCKRMFKKKEGAICDFSELSELFQEEKQNASKM
ncbi:MAG: hypothetical protein ACTHMC_23570 [Pseudobacter sp.]|uniref:hypothetical protein n=1 Tax=Pseudobacter sp. TaxID=2045420 RepID=UPI003F7E2894